MSFVDAFSIKIHLIDYWRHLIERKKKKPRMQNSICNHCCTVRHQFNEIIYLHIYIFIYRYLFNVMDTFLINEKFKGRWIVRDAKRGWRRGNAGNRSDFSIKITINRKTLDTNELQLRVYRPRDYRSNLKYLYYRYHSIVPKKKRKKNSWTLNTVES